MRWFTQVAKARKKIQVHMNPTLLRGTIYDSPIVTLQLVHDIVLCSFPKVVPRLGACHFNTRLEP